MAHPTMPRDVLIDRLAVVFREHGYDGASLTRLSAGTGLGKASLYYQFPNGKEDMAQAVLASVDAQFAGMVLAPLSGPATARQRLAGMAAALSDFYLGGRRGCVLDLFGIGEAGTLFREHLARTVGGFIAALAAVSEEAGHPAEEAARRAEDALVSIEGALVLSRATGSTKVFARVMAELPDRLLS